MRTQSNKNPWDDARVEKFLTRIDTSGDCWLWTGSVAPNGYGMFNFRNVLFSAHRYAWMLEHGPIPDGLLVCHDCDKNYSPADRTYRRCVRPDHLFLGTHGDNMRDASEKGRLRQGENHWIHKQPERSPFTLYLQRRAAGGPRTNPALTEERVIMARLRFEDGESCRSIARDYGVPVSTMQSAISGKTWPHLPFAWTTDA